MIIVQDLEKNYLSSHVTLKGFMDYYIEKPKTKYSYIVKKLSNAGGKTVRYRGFFITKDKVKKVNKANIKIRNKLKNNRFYNS